MRVRIVMFEDNGQPRWPVMDVVECEFDKIRGVLNEYFIKSRGLGRNQRNELCMAGGSRVRIEIEPCLEEGPTIYTQDPPQSVFRGIAHMPQWCSICSKHITSHRPKLIGDGQKYCPTDGG